MNETEQNKFKKFITKTKQIIISFFKKVSAFLTSRTPRQWLHYVYYLVLFAAIINVIIMTLHLIDPNYNYPILQHSYVSAIDQGQDTDETMYTSIIRITKPRNGFEVGDKVLIYGDYGINEYWVEEVVSVNDSNNTVELTYDGVSAVFRSQDDIIGDYDVEASFLQTMYYAAKFSRGFILITMIHFIIVAFMYFESYDKLHKDEEDSKK